jgi:hypothetical protein
MASASIPDPGGGKHLRLLRSKELVVYLSSRVPPRTSRDTQNRASTHAFNRVGARVGPPSHWRFPIYGTRETRPAHRQSTQHAHFKKKRFHPYGTSRARGTEGQTTRRRVPRLLHSLPGVTSPTSQPTGGIIPGAMVNVKTNEPITEDEAPVSYEQGQATVTVRCIIRGFPGSGNACGAAT